MPEASSSDLFVGVDIAAATFTASWATTPTIRDRPSTFPQSPDGFTALQQALRDTGVPPGATLVVMEATSS